MTCTAANIRDERLAGRNHAEAPFALCRGKQNDCLALATGHKKGLWIWRNIRPRRSRNSDVMYRVMTAYNPKQKWQLKYAFFLGENGRRQYSHTCRKCARSCNQGFQAWLIVCLHYSSGVICTPNTGCPVLGVIS